MAWTSNRGSAWYKIPNTNSSARFSDFFVHFDPRDLVGVDTNEIKRKYRWVSATLSQVPIQSIGTYDSVALTQQCSHNCTIK